MSRIVFFTGKSLSNVSHKDKQIIGKLRQREKFDKQKRQVLSFS